MDYITATRSDDVIHSQLREYGSGYETRFSGVGVRTGRLILLDAGWRRIRQLTTINHNNATVFLGGKK